VSTRPLGGPVAAEGRKARGRRAVDLLTAAIALAEGVSLYKRNPDDFPGLGGLLDMRVLDAAE
jgi:predicted nucleic acid-binding protein